MSGVIPARFQVECILASSQLPGVAVTLALVCCHRDYSFVSLPPERPVLAGAPVPELGLTLMLNYLMLTWLHLERPYFQAGLLLQVQFGGVGGDILQPIICTHVRSLQRVCGKCALSEKTMCEFPNFWQWNKLSVLSFQSIFPHTF